MTGAKARFDPQIAAFLPSQLRKLVPECSNVRLRDRSVLRQVKQRANHLHRADLLRTCDERPCGCRAAEQPDELAPPHVWMAPAWQEEMQRAARKSLAVMCPACSRSPDGLLALMESANRGLITRTKPPQPWAGIPSFAASPPRRYAPSCSLAPRLRPAAAAADAVRSPTDRPWSPSIAADSRSPH